MVVRLILSLLLFAPLLGAQAQGPQPPPARVVAAEVTSEVLSPSGRMVGVLRFTQVAQVAAEVEGLIGSHHFDTGWVLKRGEVMAELNTDFLEKDRDIIRSQIQEADAEIEKLAREVERLDSLKRGQMTSRSAYEEAFYSHKILQERKKTLQTRLHRMQLSIEKSRVVAPFDGIVLEKLKDQGDWLGRGGVLARLGSTAGVQAIIPVSETLLPYQQAGQPFEVTIPALQRTLQGTLAGVVPYAELRSKSVYLKIALPYEPGMIEHLTVEAQVPSAKPRQLSLIPRAALLQNPGPPSVYSVVEGKAVPVGVNIVARRGEFIAVDGAEIAAGTQVIVDGNDRLRPGQAVQVVAPGP